MEITELKTGWLAPDGELFECNCYDHISKAREICDLLKYPFRGYPTKGCGADDVLYNKGWVHISISLFLCREWRISWKGFLTEYQKSFLKPYFEDYTPVCDMDLYRWKKENDLFEYDEDGFII